MRSISSVVQTAARRLDAHQRVTSIHPSRVPEPDVPERALLRLRPTATTIVGWQKCRRAVSRRQTEQRLRFRSREIGVAELLDQPDRARLRRAQSPIDHDPVVARIPRRALHPLAQHASLDLLAHVAGGDVRQLVQTAVVDLGVVGVGSRSRRVCSRARPPRPRIVDPHPFFVDPAQQLLNPWVAGVTRNEPAMLHPQRPRHHRAVFTGIALQDSGGDHRRRGRHQTAAPDGEGALRSVEEIAQARLARRDRRHADRGDRPLDRLDAGRASDTLRPAQLARPGELQFERRGAPHVRDRDPVPEESGVEAIDAVGERNRGQAVWRRHRALFPLQSGVRDIAGTARGIRTGVHNTIRPLAVGNHSASAPHIPVRQAQE